MVEGDGPLEETEMETEDINSDEEALYHFSRYSEARAALPWDQRTLKEKVLHHIDRIFMCLLALFLLILFGEFIYKMWYVTSWRKIWDLILELVSFLFTQEKDENLIEL